MAEIIWTKAVRIKLKNHLDYAYREFGAKTMKKWLEQIEYHKDSFKKFPTSYTPVRELSNEDTIYRGCTVMGRFKLIYYYDEQADMVYIVDLWDVRRNPENLIREFNISRNNRWQS